MPVLAYAEVGIYKKEKKKVRKQENTLWPKKRSRKKSALDQKSSQEKERKKQ